MTNGNVKGLAITWDNVKGFLLVLGIFAAIFGSWYAASTRVTRVEDRLTVVSDRVNKLESQLESLNPTLTDIQVRLAEIQRDLIYIKGELAEQNKSGVMTPSIGTAWYHLAMGGIGGLTPFRAK